MQIVPGAGRGSPSCTPQRQVHRTENFRHARRKVATPRAIVFAPNERRNGFVQVVKKAMETRLGSSSDEVLKVLAKKGITQALAKEALQVARSHGAFAIFAVVDALTRISGKLANAGARSEVDQKASALLSLAK